MSNSSQVTRNRLLTGVLLLVMLLSTVVGVASASGLREAAQPEAGDNTQPDRIIRTAGARPGIYYIDYGSSLFDPGTYPFDGAIRFYGWSVLNPGDNSYNWTELDNWIASRKAAGLGTGIMLTTYDGSTSGDIRSTPNFVIKQANAVLPATYKDSSSSTTEYPHYASYWRSSASNAGFDLSTPDYGWRMSGNVSVASSPPVPADASGIAQGNAAQLGGINDAAGYIYHVDERIPAMPATISPAKTVYITARVGIETTDPNPNDHLYMEVWDTSNNKLGGVQVDINNLSHANGTWETYEFDVSGFTTERSIRVAFRVATDSDNPTTFYVDSTSLNVRHLIPNYWPDAEAQRTYYRAYRKFIQALGARYKDNIDLQFVAIGAGVYGENQPTQSDSFPFYNFDHVVEKYGNLTGSDWLQYVNQLSLDYATAFSAGDGSGPARHILTQYAPVYKSSTERRDTSDYAQSVGVGLSANFLPFDWPQSYRPLNDGFYDPVRRYGSSVPIAFEAYTMDLCNPVMSYWALYGGLDKHVDYLRVDPTLVRNYDGSLTAHAPFFEWAGDYVGQTAQTTPKVWTVMREHHNPTLSNCRNGGLYYQRPGVGGTYPQLGNFNYFLVQDDRIAGGRTVPETNNKGSDSRYAKDPTTGTLWPDAGLGNCPTTNSYRSDLFGTNYACFPTPYNPDLPALGGQNANYFNIREWTGSGKEAFTVRRTDQGTGNPYMFFKVDDGYIPGTQVYKANITVGYFDIGTDTWSLKYHSITGEKVADVVTKTDTKQYKEVTFTVNDAKFANGLTGGADFLLDSRAADGASDGNEWIHKVEVERLEANAEPTSTPTVTPTSTPSTGGVEGKAYNDINGNGIMDVGEPGIAGAVISLSYPLGTEKYLATSGDNGTYRFTNVDPGQYWLAEKTAPVGFRLSSHSVVIVVQANSTVTLGTNIGHEALATATPTPTLTPTTTPGTPVPLSNKTYLPLILK